LIKPFQTNKKKKKIGVGPKEELQSKGIPVVNDLPVGRNLQDHLFVFHSFETLDGEGFCFRKDWRISKYILKVSRTKFGQKRSLIKLNCFFFKKKNSIFF